MKLVKLGFKYLHFQSSSWSRGGRGGFALFRNMHNICYAKLLEIIGYLTLLCPVHNRFLDPFVDSVCLRRLCLCRASQELVPNVSTESYWRKVGVSGGLGCAALEPLVWQSCVCMVLQKPAHNNTGNLGNCASSKTVLLSPGQRCVWVRMALKCFKMLPDIHSWCTIKSCRPEPA